MRAFLAVFLTVVSAAAVAACSPAQGTARGDSVGLQAAPGPARPNIAVPGGALAGQHDSAAAPTSADASQLTDRVIIRTTALNLTVDNVAQAVQDVQSLVVRMGGQVASARYKNEGQHSPAVLSVRIPSELVDVFLRDVRSRAIKVNEETTSSQDVTEEYTDLGSQLRSQEATEAQYLELMKKATTVDEILKVQGQLNQIRGQIEKTRGRMLFLERRSDLTQIDLTFQPVPPTVVPPVDPQWDPFWIAQRSWDASLMVLRSLAAVGIAIAVFLWWLVPVGLVAYWLALAISRRRAPATTTEG